MTGAYIEAIATHLPETVVTNDDLARQHPEWNMARVAERTGIHARHVCAPDETALDLAVPAVAAVLAHARCTPAEVDTLLFCTQTPDYVMPPNACLLQDRLGFPRTIAAMDFTHACSGFVYGLYLAKGLVTSGMANRVLLVTAETYSKRISPRDRGATTIFGDAAAATLVTAGRSGIRQMSLGTDGGAFRSFFVPRGGARSGPPTVLDETTEMPGTLAMDGPGVLAFVHDTVPRHILSSLREWGCTWADIHLVVLHQASRIALDAVGRAAGIPPDKVYRNLDAIGNTVSASLPVALHQAAASGRLTPGMRVLVCGFGVGMSWGSAIIVWMPRD